MNCEEEFERIKKKYKELGEIDIFSIKDLSDITIGLFQDIGVLINMADTLNKRAKMNLNSQYGYQVTDSIERKRKMKNQDIEVITTDGVFNFSNVYIEIYDNKIIIIGEGELTQFNMQYLMSYNLKPHKEIKLEKKMN